MQNHVAKFQLEEFLSANYFSNENFKFTICVASKYRRIIFVGFSLYDIGKILDEASKISELLKVATVDPRYTLCRTFMQIFIIFKFFSRTAITQQFLFCDYFEDFVFFKLLTLDKVLEKNFSNKRVIYKNSRGPKLEPCGTFAAFVDFRPSYFNTLFPHLLILILYQRYSTFKNVYHEEEIT